jgi:hypothetical protein
MSTKEDPRISRANVAPARPSQEWVDEQRKKLGFAMGSEEAERRIEQLEKTFRHRQ